MLNGPRYVFKGLRLITQPGVRTYVLIPFFINTLTFAAIIIYGAHLFGDLIDWLLPNWLHWLDWLLWPFFAAFALVFVFLSFVVIANVIGAPFNGLLAEAVETKLTGRTQNNQGARKALPRQLVSSLLAELHKLVYFVLWAVPLIILFLIPGLNIAAPFIWVLFSAWVLALEYLSYPMENHRISFRKQRRLLAARRMLALSFGGTVLLITVIPVLNFISMPVAVAAATALWVDQLDSSVGNDS
ncbi:MAG: sulfate transporter CysZ [Gammaproteobacteria bacterium]|nr:sulfate transporter CysZ [Gammaproteobacteria bacterium]MCI0590366.1 sulfate transporter CysZ [Gammaproteobacteria bacterium]